MPSSAALASFEPAPGPATTRSVFLETEAATFAPSRSAIALASSRVIRSSEPVKTIVLPATGLADMPDSERINKTVERQRAARLDRVEKIPHRKLAKAFPLFQIDQAAPLAIRKRENIGGCLNQAIAEKLLNPLVAEALDIERIAR